MKKNLFYILTFLFTIAIFASCDETKENNSQNYKENNLVLIYSEAPMFGKSVAVSINGTTASITLNGVIPGQLTTSLEPVEVDGTSTEYTVSGKSNVDGNSISYAGQLKAGVFTISITNIIPNISLVNKWYFYHDFSDLPAILPVNLNWVTQSGMIYIDADGDGIPITDNLGEDSNMLTQLNLALSGAILSASSFMDFQNDGNIVLDIILPEGAGTMLSPKNVITYNIESEGKLNLFLNPSYDNSDFRSKSNVNLLTEIVAGFINNGVPAVYVKNGDELTLTIEKETFLPIFNQIDVIIALIVEMEKEMGGSAEVIAGIESVGAGLKRTFAETEEFSITIKLSSINPNPSSQQNFQTRLSLADIFLK